MHILDSLLAFSAYFFIGVAMVIIFLFIGDAANLLI